MTRTIHEEGEDHQRSFIKVDRQTLEQIMSKLGERGPRAVVFWIACISLANRQRLTNDQPELEKLNWPYLSEVSGIPERTLHRLKRPLEQCGIMQIKAKRHEVKIKILAGYWPNGGTGADQIETPTPAPAERKTSTKTAGPIPERLKPAYEALLATGKMKSITPHILQRVEATHPKANFLARINEVVERLEVIDSSIGDPGAWLMARAREMEFEASRPAAGISNRQPVNLNTEPSRLLWNELQRRNLAPGFPNSEGLKYAMMDCKDLPSVSDCMGDYVEAARRIKADDLSQIAWSERLIEEAKLIHYARTFGPPAGV